MKRDVDNVTKWFFALFTLLLFVFSAYAIDHSSGRFPLSPDISCNYDEDSEEIVYKIHNDLDRTLHLSMAPYDLGAMSHLSVILNGRIVEPEDHCDTLLVGPGETATCTIPFDPDKKKTDIFRMYHQYSWLTEYSGAAPRNVLRFRILHNGQKIRQNIKFSCLNTASLPDRLSLVN